ncbi:ubiquinol oxidase subunit II [Yoonia maritima]|uniref:ubiquinol oxidase subunit II n=1 Tax=Yoonia maritima TaxID=1435347 RepID=UPI001EF929B7|nr:ubiquinol oxidase subunit II [Yoonia maritima]
MFKYIKYLLALAGAFALSGCQYHILSPQGWVGIQERNLLVIATLLMLIIIIPVLIMAVYFPLKYRADRSDLSDYDPTFEHSNKIEVAVWGIPILITAALGWYTYVYTHRLDPYRPLDHLQAGIPIEVDAVSLDWKWLFIYPEFGVASVNELAVPVGRPVNFRLTSSTVMNTLSIPALGGMVYSMAGMETQLHLVADAPGVFPGRSAHYSGPGFSHMTFDTLSMSDADFNSWIANAKSDGTDLGRETYLTLEKPSIADPVRYFATVEDGLFDHVVEMCVDGGTVCAGQIMTQDKTGGGGIAGVPNAAAYSYDSKRAIDGFGALIDLPTLNPEAFYEAFLNSPDYICGPSARKEAVSHVN